MPYELEDFIANPRLGMVPLDEERVWAVENRGYVLTRWGLSRANFSVTGVEVFENEEWGVRPKYVGVMGEFYVEPELLPDGSAQPPYAEGVGVGVDTLSGPAIDEVDLLIDEHDFVLRADGSENDPSIFGLNAPEQQAKVRFLATTDEIDCGEPDATKHLYWSVLVNDCKQTMLFYVERKMNVRDDEWEMSELVVLEPGQAAFLSFAFVVMRMSWWVDQYAQFKAGRARARWRLVDYRRLHGQPMVLSEASQ